MMKDLNRRLADKQLVLPPDPRGKGSSSLMQPMIRCTAPVRCAVTSSIPWKR